MDLKQREEAARQIAASVKEAIDRILGDPTIGDQIVRADNPKRSLNN